MKAMLCHAPGAPAALKLEDIATPEPGPGELRIQVKACGVNFADTLIIAAGYQVKPPYPFSPGMEVAGVVDAVGEGVNNYKPGDRVMAIINWGGYAEAVVANAMSVLPMPPSMDFPTAAAFPIAYGTSHLALDHRGRLKPGETLLVFGAAGGVGLTAVEIGKHMGATVIACASTPEKLAITRQYGADHTINYREESIRDRVRELTNGKGADVVYDPVGGDAFDQAMRAINWEGRLLVIGFTSGRIPELPVNLTLVKNCAVVGVYWGAYAQKDPGTLVGSLMTLLNWYSEGHLKPHVSATYPLAEAPAAMQVLMNRQSTGKVVITME
ncbi:MAG: NADPH:quinone oxidoreductase family protein [Chloroflexota bacterium]